MLPDDIIIEITKLLTIREYHRLSLTEKYFNWLLHQDICVQYYLQRHDWFHERGEGWSRFINKFGSWNCLRQGLQSVMKAATGWSYSYSNFNKIAKTPIMEFAWGPTCGNYWKRKKLKSNDDYILELDKPLHWFSFRGLTKITISGHYTVMLVCSFCENVILTPLKITVFKDNRPDTELYNNQWSREQQNLLERDKWHKVVIVDNVYLEGTNENENKYSIRVENTRHYTKGYRISQLRLIPVL